MPMDNLTIASIVGVLSLLALILGLVSSFVKFIDKAKADTVVLTKMQLSLENVDKNTADSNVRIKALEDEVQKSKSWREHYTGDVDDLIIFKSDQKLINQETKQILSTYDKLITSNQRRLDKIEKHELSDFK